MTRQSRKYAAYSFVGAFLLCTGLFFYFFGHSNHNPIQSPQILTKGHCSTINATSTQNNEQFAFDIFSCYRQQSGNVLLSPYSLKIALAMVAEGANGETSDEILRALHIPSNNDDATRMRINSFAQDFENGTDELKISNHLWVQKDFPIKQDFVTIITKKYVGGVTTLDFQDAKNADQTINGWVANQTGGEIKNFLPPASITSLTRLLVTNAIAFSGKWLLPFKENDTHSADFQLASGDKVSTPMMSLTGERAQFKYAEINEMQVIELPYANTQFSMLILLPKSLSLDKSVEFLTPSALDSIRRSMTEQRVNVYIPRFVMQTEYSMTDQLKQLGVSMAFSEDADFSNVSDKPGLHIGGAYQQAMLEVNEGGTKVAAGTALNMDTLGIELQEPPTFRADHPFMFVIQNHTGEILFIGLLQNPEPN